MSKPDIVYMTEETSHDGVIRLINEEAFGPGRFARAAERVREQGPHDASLSFVAADDGAIVGSVRLTPVLAGLAFAHLLGPLAVRPSHKNLGIGRELVRLSVAAARKSSECVVLVGDPPYYRPLGFEPAPYGTLIFPGPVDPARVLARPSDAGVMARLKGPLKWRAT